jgi:DNA modification methylase
MARPIINHTLPGDVVYEPFSGSGTTLVACEQLGRVCCAIEINPSYVAIALQRWADLTGLMPEVQDGAT